MIIVRKGMQQFEKGAVKASVLMKRGRKMRTQPTERDKLAKYWAISKQRISQIRKRWSYGRYKGYKPSQVVEETHTWTSPSE